MLKTYSKDFWLNTLNDWMIEVAMFDEYEIRKNDLRTLREI